MCAHRACLAFPKVDSISDVVIAEGEPIINAVSVIEGRPNPIVTLINTTRDQSLMLVALNSAQYQIRKTRASISDGGVYRVEATNAVGKDIINFTVTVHCKLHGIRHTRKILHILFLDSS